MSRTVLVPHLILLLLYALVGAHPVALGMLSLGALIAWLAMGRVKAGRVMQYLAHLVFFAAAATVLVAEMSTQSVRPGQLSAVWNAAAGAGLAVMAARYLLAKPMGGENASLAIGLVVLTACGGGKVGWVYPALVVSYLVAAFWVRRHCDAGSAPTSHLVGNRAWLLAVQLLLATAIAVGWSATLPPMHQWALRKIMLSGMSRSGFSDRLWLGSMRGMLASDKKVMRVRGQAGGLLRGVVYSRYLAGRWNLSEKYKLTRVAPPRKLPDAQSNVEIEFVDGEPLRYFLPLDASQVAITTGVAEVDGAGILSPMRSQSADRISFQRGAKRAYPVALPGPEDLLVPPDVVASLRPLVAQWTRGATTVASRLDLIERTLQTAYGYSLDFEHDGESDPVVRFLLEGKQGHCEYFASAMALLSRVAGVPARVVGGYRVHEYNELGGYYIVRERNAHAWVEAWVQGQGWVAFDPTPQGDLALTVEATTPLWGALADLLRVRMRLMSKWMGEHATALAVSGGGGTLFLFWMKRWMRRRRRRQERVTELTASEPLPCFLRLDLALSSLGISRGASETVEQLATRIEQASQPAAWTSGAASLLRRYSELRFGRTGDAKVLAIDIDAFCSAFTVAR